MMTDEELAELMGLLLQARAYRCGSPIRDIQVNTEGRAKDDGCDGWSAKPATADSWLGMTDTCWQFKAGSAGEPSRLAGEATKPIPKETLSKGGRFVVVASGSKNGTKGEQDRLKKLIKAASAANLPTNNIEVLGSERLTNWCNEHPAIAARWAGRPEGLWTLEDWSNQAQHQVVWQASAEVEEEFNARRADLDFATGEVLHLHIYGHPGVGKTRFALELCRRAAWCRNVIYIRQATDIRLAELIDSAATDGDVQLVVVADEVQPSQLEPLRDSIERGGGRIRLITIGTSKSPDLARIPSFRVEPLPADLMRKVIAGWHPGMPLEHVEFIRQFADGYIRLAKLTADTIAKNPTMNVRGLLNQEDIQGFLDKMLGPGDHRPLYVVAVLNSVGWTDDKENEGKAIAKHLGMDWNLIRASVEDFDHRLWIAPQGGRYRYISPTPLGVHLAVEAWKTFPDLLRSLPDILPSDESRDAYYERMRSIASNPQAREYAREQLAFFFSIDNFIDARVVRRWSALSSAAPSEAAHNILKALIAASLEDRTAITGQARREVIWTLVNLAWRTESFHDAVKALALLAEAENESWANNATGEFIARFQIYLGGTALPYRDRLSVIDELLTEKRTSLTILAVKALAQFSNRQAFRTVSNTTTDEPPEKEWRPSVQGELLECADIALDRLTGIAKQGLPELRADLVATAIGLSMLLRESAIRELVANFLEAVREAYPDAREPLRRSIADVIKGERKYWKVLSADELTKLDELHTSFEDTTLSGRLQQMVGPAAWDPEEQPDLKPLAKELLSARDVLMDQWSWLTSGQAQSAWLLGEALAALDLKEELAETLPAIPGAGKDLRLLCAYIGAKRQVLGDDWYDKWVIIQSERNPKPVALLFEVAWRCGTTDTVAKILNEILRGQRVSPQIVGQLSFGQWSEKLSVSILEPILRAMVDAGHQEVAIAILENRLRLSPNEADLWKPLALQMVMDPALIRTRNVMPDFYWKQVATFIVNYYPVEIASAIFREQADRSKSDTWFAEYSEAAEVLIACVLKDPRGIWQAMQPYLSSSDNVYRFSVGFPRGVLERVPPDAIEVWVAENPDERALIVAKLVNKDLSSDVTLTARILGKYADNDRIGSAFFSEYITGMWEGPASFHWDQLAVSLDQVAGRTALPKLRRWANKSAKALREMADREQQREQEDDLRRR